MHHPPPGCVWLPPACTHTSNYTWKVKIVASTASFGRAHVCVCVQVCVPYEVNYLSFACLTAGQPERQWGMGGGTVAVGLPPGCQLPGLCRLRRALFDCLSLHKSQPALNLKRRSSSTSTSFWRFFYVPFFHLPPFSTFRICPTTQLPLALLSAWLLLVTAAAGQAMNSIN